MTKNLYQSLYNQKQNTSLSDEILTGMLGANIGGQQLVDVPNRANFVYVRLRQNPNEIIQAFNNQVSQSYDLPVLLHYAGFRYEILNVDTARYGANWGNVSPFLPKHGIQHSFPDDLSQGGGGDISWIYPRQYVPMLATPSGTGAPNILVSSYIRHLDNGNWYYDAVTGTQNLTPTYNPATTGAIIALIYKDFDSGNPYILAGATFPESFTKTQDIVPYIPALPNPRAIPITAIRLVSGTSAITWANMLDVRQWFYPLITGTGGTDPIGPAGGNLTGTYPNPSVKWVDGKAYYDTIYAATGTSLPDAPINTNIYGRQSGTWIALSTGTLIQDEGIPQGIVQTFNFIGNNVDASVSGTVARIFITGSAGGGGISSGTIQVYNNGTFAGSADKFDFQYPIYAGFTGTKAYPAIQTTVIPILAIEDVSGQLITGSYITHFTLTGTIQSQTDGLYYNGLRQQRNTHYTVDGNNKGFTTLFTGTYGDTLVMEYGNVGAQNTTGTIAIQSLGLALGSASTLDFEGTNVSASISGTVARVFITGSGGGLSSVGINDEGISQGNVTTLNFVGGNVDASVSGSVARIFITGSTGGGFTPSHFQLPILSPDSNTNFSTIASDKPWPYIVSSGAQNDVAGYNISLPAGTYTWILISHKDTNRGIYHLREGASDLATIDGYAGAGNLIVDKVTGIVMVGGTLDALSIKMATKNASSSAYYGTPALSWLIKTS